jgi:L-asparagine oxygenase
MPWDARVRDAAESLEATGYALLSDFDGDELLDFSSRSGVVVSDTRSSDLVKDLRPREPEASPRNTLSHRYGTGAFPLHTETAYWRRPARYVFLHCLAPGQGGRPTLVVDVTPRLSDEEARALTGSLWVVGRTRRPFLAPMLEAVSGCLRLRFDPECVSPAEGAAVRASELLDAFLERQPVVPIAWCEGDLLVLDNFRVIHGRGMSDVPDPDRHLQRVLVAGEEVPR